MAGMNVPMNRPASRIASSPVVRAPRVLMSWEDWLTLIPALIAFLAVAVSIQNAGWVRNFPPLVPTVLCAVLIGMVGARIRVSAVIVHPIAIAIGAGIVVLAVQSYADGITFSERLHDFQARMMEWFAVVRANDISNDNLPFVTLVHSVSFLAVYMGSYVIYRWHNPWIALLPAAIVLLANTAFLDGQPSEAFVIFLFGAILLVARLHLQQSQARWKRQGVEYPDFISLSAVQLALGVAAGLMIVAWLVPLGTQAKAVEGAYDAVTSPFTGNSDRFVRLFHNIDSRKGANLHNFGSTLPIQGNVTLGTKIIAEAKASSPGLLRATSYEIYTGAGWKAGDRDTERVDGGTVAASPDVLQYAERTQAPLQITVRDDTGTILTPGMPLGTNRDVTIETPEGFRGDIEQIKLRRGLDEGDTYNALGSLSTATAEQLIAAGTAYPDWVAERYLQLPDDLPQRVRDEALRVAGTGSPYEQAAAIEAYLRTFPYNLEVAGAPPRQDVVDYFLFDLKQGYFDFHATAMAVMLRALDIPSRLAVGYALDADEATNGTYTVRKDDAYSWVEVWFPDYGWIEFNPTPDRPGGGAGASSSMDTSGFPTDGFDDLGLEGLFPELDPDLLPGDTGGIGQDFIAENPTDVSRPPWTLIWVLTGLLTAAAAIAIAGRLTWNWGLGGLEGRAKLWAKTHRLAGWAGLGSHDHETPREWSRRVGGAVAREEDAVTLASAYEESRYGRPDRQAIDDATAESSYRELRRSLFGKLLHRKQKPPE